MASVLNPSVDEAQPATTNTALVVRQPTCCEQQGRYNRHQELLQKQQALLQKQLPELLQKKMQ